MALAHSTMVPLGTQAPAFELPGTDGKLYSLDSFQDKEVLAIVFMCNHCPYVKAVLPRLIDLQNRFAGKSVQFVGINANDAVKYPDDSMESMQRIVKEKNIPFPYLFDETQQVAKAYDAVCTPDIYVFGSERTLQYRGRIDDNWEHPEKVTKHDLEDALNAILDGQLMTQEQIPSMGCSIKWK
ncbi:thioredoxin family protein [Nitrospina watsonii]|uniref:PPO candidate 1 n=1 Tax=Nitrospina watsonii TaxID=1323948 RepID=A0ABN8VTZ5_9BACT|nr:thioredoxin family protein [Nitrospina watsonii]CAI2717357.1 PPO candidate 1 [Nitrospina watsonii]